MNVITTARSLWTGGTVVLSLPELRALLRLTAGLIICNGQLHELTYQPVGKLYRVTAVFPAKRKRRAA